MKHGVNLPSKILLTIFVLLLTGCASNIRSNVSVFHQWPADVGDKSYTFDVPPSHQANEEYAQLQNVLRTELKLQGFTEAAAPQAAKFSVLLQYATTPWEVRTLQPIYADPFWPGDPFWYRHRWYRYRFGYYYYDPFWYGPPLIYRQSVEVRHRHQLQIRITEQAGGKKLYEANVENNSSQSVPLLTVMPLMIKSAFSDFPGKSGSTYHVDFKLEEE